MEEKNSNEKIIEQAEQIVKEIKPEQNVSPKTSKKKVTATPKRNNANFYKIICIILAMALIVVLALWLKDFYGRSKADDKYDALVNQVNNISGSSQNGPADSTETETNAQDDEDEENPLEGIDIPKKNLDFKKLRKTNKDIYAWICIPNTKIDYPIVQSDEDDYYYLDHNLDGSKGYPGCIYTEMLNEKDFTDFNTVIYGHNMKNGTMFQNLHKFEDSKFFLKNRYVFVYTEDKTLVYEIYAAFLANDSHILNTNDYSTSSGRQEYINEVLNVKNVKANIYNDVKVDAYNHIISLSTCTSDSSKRWIVQAVLVNEADLGSTLENR